MIRILRHNSGMYKMGERMREKNLKFPIHPKTEWWNSYIVILYVDFDLFALDFLVCKIKELEFQKFWYMCLDR